MYKIEQGVPIPGRGVLYPFEKMNTGDSFFVPLGEGKHPTDLQTSIRTSCYRRFGTKKFSIRRVKQDGIIIGARCWCIES